MARPNTYIRFAGTELKGTPEWYQRPSPEPKFIRRQWPGTIGESEIRMGQSGRTLQIPFVLHDAHATVEDVLALVKTWQEMVGVEHGTLVINAAYEETFDLCSLDVVAQLQPILPGIPGNAANSSIEGYWTRLMFVFRQLALQ